MIACFIRRLLSEHKRLILYPRYAQGEFRFYTLMRILSTDRAVNDIFVKNFTVSPHGLSERIFSCHSALNSFVIHEV